MKAKSVRKPPERKRNAMESLVAGSAHALGLKLDPSWQAGVEFNLQLIFSHANLVDEFPLTDIAEPAEVFHA